MTFMHPPRPRAATWISLACSLGVLAMAASLHSQTSKKPAKAPKAPAKTDGGLPPIEIVPGDENAEAPKKQPSAKPKENHAAKDRKKPAAAKAPPKKATAKGKNKFVPLPADPLLPDGTCPMCLGTSYVPLAGRQIYVHVEGDRPPRAEMCVPWQPCPQCNAEGEVQALVDAEKLRLQTAGATHLEWEKRMGMPLVRVETRHGIFHCQMSPDVARKQGEAAEATIAYIQKTTRGTLLTPTRPGTFEMLYLWDKKTYERAIEVCKNLDDFSKADDWHLFSQLACFNGALTTVGNAQEGKSAPPEHLVISQTAIHQLHDATAGHARHWLSVGFAYHCEHAVKSKILMHYVRYQLNEVRLGPNWPSEAKKMAGEGKLIPWSEMLEADLVAWTPPHHVSAFAMVSYLIRSDPVRFAKTMVLIREGQPAQAAMEKIYGKPMAQLEAAYAKWILQ